MAKTKGKFMNRQEKIEELQDKVRKNYITNIEELNKYEPEIDVFNDVLSPMEWNVCNKCGDLYKSDELYWTDYLDPEYDQDLIDAVEAYDQELCAICCECAKELRHE